MDKKAERGFGDREICGDALNSQKQITDSYNALANECAAPQLRDTLINLLNEEHQIGADLFGEMSKRGWYPVQPADPEKVARAKQRFSDTP